MKIRKSIIQTTALIVTCFFIAATPLTGIAQTGSTAPPTAVKASDRFVSIDFNNVDITIFIKFISELTGKNFIVDRRVKGKVTIISPTRISA